MSALQSSTGLSIDFSNLPAATAEAFRSAAASIHQWVERQDQGSEAFAGFEVELLKHACAICRAAVGDYIEARDVEEGPVHREGQVFYRAAPTQKTIHTLFGPVTFSRSRYRVHSGSSSIAPVDESLGLVDGYLTVPAAYRALLVMDHCTPRDAAKLFEKLGGMNPSSSHLRRLLVTAGNLWKEKGEVALDTIRKAKPVPTEAVSFAVSLDGVMVALRSNGREEACWREASCGTVSFHDADGNRLETLYFAQMPEAGKVTLKAQIAEEVAYIRKVRSDLRLVAVADAAADNWTFLERLQPDKQAVDFFHACEHLSDVADHAVTTDWYDKYRTVLRDDANGIDKVIRAIRHLRDKATTATALKDLERELRFFRKHRSRMRYANLNVMGYTIGSGVVEAANKVLVNQRMKRAGMRWSIEGGQNVLTFRALMRSGRFDSAWQAMVGASIVNDNQEAIAA